MLAFGIAALIFSVIAVFIPVFGIMISGLSGILAWFSTGKGTPFGAAAIIINFINILFLSPAYLLVASLEATQRTHDQAILFTIWTIILLIQIAAVVVFIGNVPLANFLKQRTKQNDQIDILSLSKQYPAKDFAKAEDNQSMLSEPLLYQTEQAPRECSQEISKVTKAPCVRIVVASSRRVVCEEGA